jgi:hypothetical protein
MAGRLALVLGSVLFTLIVAELGARLWRGPATLLDWQNIVLRERRNTATHHNAGRQIHDPELGFVPRPAISKDGFTYDANGYRVTPPDSATPAILVVGDSFAHGDELADHEAWPSRVQSLLGRRVVNAAVSGYGLDQAILRAERAAADVRPAVIVLSFIGDDLRRSEMRRVWGAEKPYFELVNGALEPRNVPVPRPPDPATTLDIWQTLFGWSVALDSLLRHKGWQYEWALDFERVLPRGGGEALACPLMKRLAALGVPTLVVAERDTYTWKDADYAREQHRKAAVVLKCAAAAKLATLDLFEVIDQAVRKHGHAAVFRSSHPSPLGADIAAARIAGELQLRHMPTR